MKRSSNKWVFTKLYTDGRKEIKDVYSKKFDKDFAKDYSDIVFKEETSCIVVYAYYLKSFLFSKRYFIWNGNKNFCFNRNGLEF